MNGWSLFLLILGLLLGGSFPAAGASYGLPLDAPEQAAMAETFQYAMEHNQHQQESTWTNPESGHAGTIMPVRTFYSSQGLYCREYFQTLRFGDTLDRRLGVACRQPDGVWEMLHEQLLSEAELELEGVPYTYVYRDPAEHYYPWVYYDPFDYPYPIYFSFIFVSHHHHFHPRHFHSGHRFHPHQFRDDHGGSPRQRLHRDQRSDAPLVREQPTAPRFDRGQAPRQRLDGERGHNQRRRDRVELRDQQVQQPEGVPPGVVRVIEEPAPPANPSRKAIRIDRGEGRQPRSAAPPAAPRLRQERTPEQRGDTLLRSDQLREQRQERSGVQLRGGKGSRDEDRGRRGGDVRRSDRDRRELRDRDAIRGGGSGDRGRGRR